MTRKIISMIRRGEIRRPKSSNVGIAAYNLVVEFCWCVSIFFF
jgi:hypothetical protein